ncbi:hypothetical protein BDR05DRAFT_1035969, partial [Suillus weaverae]
LSLSTSRRLNLAYSGICKAIAHLCIQLVYIDPKLLKHPFSFNDKYGENRIHLIRDAFTAGRAAYDLLMKSEDIDARRKHRASARTALKVILAPLPRELSRPHHEYLIWDRDLFWGNRDVQRWNSNKGSKQSSDTGRVRELAHGRIPVPVIMPSGSSNGSEPSLHHGNGMWQSAPTTYETQGDALLVLSTMQGLESPTRQQSYIRSLIHCMNPTRLSRVGNTALRAAFEAREELASTTSASMQPDAQLLDKLSCALLTYTEPDFSSSLDGYKCYIYLIYALTKKDEWCQRLAHEDHLDRLEERPRWLLLITRTWVNTSRHQMEVNDYVNGIPAVVTASRLTLTALDDGVTREWLTDVSANVHLVSVDLQERQARLVKKGIAQAAAIDTALSSMQDMHTEFSRMVEQWDTSQRAWAKVTVAGS